MTKVLLSLLAVFSIPLSYADEPKTRDVVVAITDAYVPSGFDSGSDAFVVVNGIFPNSCYRLKDSKVEHVGEALHEVTTYATVTEGMCLMVMLPFNKEAHLGRLAVGEHRIHFVNGDGTYMERRLTIEN